MRPNMPGPEEPANLISMTDLDRIRGCTVTFRTVSQGARIKAAIDTASPKLMHSVADSGIRWRLNAAPSLWSG